MSEFGDRLRRTREEKGFHMRELAEHLGVSTVFVCDIERGRCIPNFEMLDRIAGFLGLDFSEIIMWEMS